MSKKLLMDYAVESGEAVAEVPMMADNAEQMLTEVLVDEVICGDDTLSEHMDRVEDTQDIAEQLENLAERVEDLAVEQDANPVSEEMVSISTESLHREFRTIMRANKLGFTATSFEAAEDHDKLKQLAVDTRRVQRIAEGHHAELMDLSEEGAISRFLNRDESKIAKALNVLAASEVALQGSMQNLKSHPVIIEHNGIAGFMTQNNQSVRNLKEAVGFDSKHLNHVHDTVQKALSTIQALAGGLKSNGGTVGPAVSKVLGGNFLGDLGSLATKGPELMGNYAFDLDGSSVHGVPKLKRVRDTKKNDSKGTIGSIVLGGLLGGVIAGPIGLVTGLVVGRNIAKHVNDEGSKVKSAAGAGDLITAVNTVKGFNKVTDYKIDTTAIDTALKAARSATEGLTPEEKTKTKEAASVLESAIARLVAATDCAYEQAFYDITTMAVTINSVVRAAKSQGEE